MENILPFNHVDGDNEFMKCIKTTSQSPEAASFRHHNVKIFNPFNSHEDDNDIIEYRGDINPDKCYFNEFSHKLFKNCK